MKNSKNPKGRERKKFNLSIESKKARKQEQNARKQESKMARKQESKKEKKRIH